MKPPFFWLGRSRLNGMTTPPYPEVTLDTFGFPVGARLAARRAVLWPQLPKVALLGPKNAVFWPETSFFVVNLKIDCYNHDGTTKRQLWLYTLTCHNISKRFAAGCYFERASTNLVDFLDKQIIILVCSWLRRAGNASQGVSIYFIYALLMLHQNLPFHWIHGVILPQTPAHFTQTQRRCSIERSNPNQQP